MCLLPNARLCPKTCAVPFVLLELKYRAEVESARPVAKSARQRQDLEVRAPRICGLGVT